MDEINEKTFGFQVSVYKGKMMLTAREMYQDEANPQGQLSWGRNGVTIRIDDAPQLIRNMVATYCEAKGITMEQFCEVLTSGDDGS